MRSSADGNGEADLSRLPPEFLSKVLRALPAGFSVTDEKGIYVEVNDRYCELLGRSRGELLGKSVFDLAFSKADRELAWRRHQEFLHGQD